jgi:FixJ family two-component response regulator
MFTGTGIAVAALLAQRTAVGARRLCCSRPNGGCERTAGGRMPKAILVSVVEDDRFFRESMRRLMRSLGYAVEAFPSAADFLASPHLVKTTCLIADVHMPAMTGVELHKHLIEMGYAIPTILITAYPNDVDRARALNDGVVCYLRKPVDEKHLMRCLRVALPSGEPAGENS